MCWGVALIYTIFVTYSGLLSWCGVWKLWISESFQSTCILEQESPPVRNRKRCTTRSITCPSANHSWWGGTPHPNLMGGHPHPVSMGVPQSSPDQWVQKGTPIQSWGGYPYPVLHGGTPVRKDGVLPSFRSKGYSLLGRMGYPPPPIGKYGRTPVNRQTLVKT